MISKVPVFINIANRGISLTSNLGLIFLIVIFLDQEMQGFYYSFYSLIFIKFFAELGLGFAIIQTISHIVSADKKIEILYSHTLFFIKWYGVASLVLLCVLVPAIYLFKEQYSLIESYNTRIVTPWICLAIATCISVFLNGLISILEGHKKILAVSKLRLIQSLVNVTIVAGGLVFGLELWSLALGGIISIIVTAIGLYKYREFYLFPAGTNKTSVNWRKEIWPFQWRLAMSWISGFFIFYFMTPLILRYSGPIAAGQMGMSLQILQAINSVAVLFVSTNAAIFGGLLAQKKLAVMESEFIACTVKATLFFIVLCGGFITVKVGLDLYIGSDITSRLVSNTDLIWLAGAGVANHVFFIMNYYFRSFKEETLWFLSIINSIAIVGIGFIFVPQYGISAAVIIYSMCNVTLWILIGVPFFVYKRKQLLNNQKISLE